MAATIYRSPGGRSPRFFASAAEFVRWAFYPYGIWHTASGREVLFNRFYEPIWARLPGGSVRAADNTEWVKGIISEDRFYGDSERTEAAKRRRATRALLDWGLPEPPLGMARQYKEQR